MICGTEVSTCERTVACDAVRTLKKANLTFVVV